MCGGVGVGFCVMCVDEDVGVGFEKILGDYLVDVVVVVGD